MPESVKSYILSQHTKYLIVFFALYILMVYSYSRNWRKGVCLMAVLFAVPGFLFNPLLKAPHRVTSNLPAFINVNAGTNRSKVLFITEDDGGRWQGNSANAVGIASLNGVHHYVDRYMFDHVYSKLQNPAESAKEMCALVLQGKADMVIGIGCLPHILKKTNVLFIILATKL